MAHNFETFSDQEKSPYNLQGGERGEGSPIGFSLNVIFLWASISRSIRKQSLQPLLRPGWHQVVVRYSEVQTADSVQMCTVLFSLTQKDNEKKALALPELSSRIRDFWEKSNRGKKRQIKTYCLLEATTFCLQCSRVVNALRSGQNWSTVIV